MLQAVPIVLPQITVWKGGAAGNFGLAANWSNGVPINNGQNTYDAVFNSSAVVTMNLAGVTTSDLSVDGGNVDLQLGGNVYMIADKLDVQPIVAGPANASLTVENGSLSVGLPPTEQDPNGTIGTITVDGSAAGNATLAFKSLDFASSNTNVGLTQSAGVAAMTLNSSSGDFGVLTVGDKGTGSLQITSSGRVTANGITVGEDTTGIGQITLSNVSKMVTGSMTVGLDGNGSLVVNSTTVNSSGEQDIGAFKGSMGVVTISGDSAWTINQADNSPGKLDVGEGSNGGAGSAYGGQLTVDGGATVVVHGDAIVGDSNPFAGRRGS